MPKTVALLRVSTDVQDVAAQRIAIERWAVANDDREVEYRVEPPVSGAASRRPVVDAVLRDARAGRIGTLVVVALDRLGRSAVRVLGLMDELHRLGVRVVSLREGIDLGSATGRLVAGIFASLAEFERELIRERTRAGLAAARRRGKVLGRPRVDWRPEEVAELQGLLAAGATLPRIARRGAFVIFDAKGKPKRPSVSAMRRALATAEKSATQVLTPAAS